MNRREAVQYISLLVGGTFVGGNAFYPVVKAIRVFPWPLPMMIFRS